MKEERLKELLSKFYNASTSPEEEEELRLYFISNEIGDEYMSEKEIFKTFTALQNSDGHVDPELSSRIIRSIERMDNSNRKTVLRHILVYSVSTAAVILIVAGSYFVFLGKKSELKDTYTDPQVAYVEAMKVLNQVSAKLNKGTKALKPVGILYASTSESMRIVDENTGKINESLGKLKVIEILNNGQNK